MKCLMGTALGAMLGVKMGLKDNKVDFVLSVFGLLVVGNFSLKRNGGFEKLELDHIFKHYFFFFIEMT